ncbi:TRAP transporter small permease [Azospirillum halopraeferens]|uniref:TRAP transporter small permease n=1 Tax=Azospirillum halopraeferens TaxID=34010 RepID=UPI000429915E|nr:TRAP transporter small permease [Azospirillum halopraeferens]
MIRRALDGVWIGVAVLLVLVTVAATLAQVLFRYVFELPLAWTEEISRMALVCAVYAAVTPAYLRGEHIVVDFFLRKLPGALAAAGVGAMKLLSLFVFAYLAWGAYLQIGRSWTMSLIAVPELTMGMIYALQFAALASLCAAVLVTWRDEGVYLSATGQAPDQ